MKLGIHLPIVLSLIAATSALAHTPPPEPGPEDGGLRLRLVVAQQAGGFDVRIEIINTTDHSLTLRAVAWDGASDAALSEYLEAAASIESYPPFPPWIGQVIFRGATSPQPAQAIGAGETLSVSWHTDGRRLKNKVTNPLEVQNPEFQAPGLYAIHATVVIDNSDRTFALRSNEQFISIGGSLAMPRHSYGTVIGVDAAAQTARLDIGTMQKVERGDRFAIHTMLGSWMLTIVDVERSTSTARVESLASASAANASGPPRFPERQMHATFVSPKR